MNKKCQIRLNVFKHKIQKDLTKMILIKLKVLSFLISLMLEIGIQMLILMIIKIKKLIKEIQYKEKAKLMYFLQNSDLYFINKYI
jgi:hypothetical protein